MFLMACLNEKRQFAWGQRLESGGDLLEDAPERVQGSALQKIFFDDLLAYRCPIAQVEVQRSQIDRFAVQEGPRGKGHAVSVATHSCHQRLSLYNPVVNANIQESDLPFRPPSSQKPVYPDEPCRRNAVRARSGRRRPVSPVAASKRIAASIPLRQVPRGRAGSTSRNRGRRGRTRTYSCAE